MKKTKIIKSVVTLTLMLGLLLGSVMTTEAATYYFRTPVTPSNGYTTFRTVYFKGYNGYGVVYSANKQYTFEEKTMRGYSYYTPVKSVSDNYEHWKGKDDLTATKCISKTHQFSTTAGGNAAKVAGSLGYSYSVSTSRSVSSTINGQFPTGYYYFGAKTKLRDLKTVGTCYEYVKRNGSYYYNGIFGPIQTSTAVRICNENGKSPLHYAWYKS